MRCYAKKEQTEEIEKRYSVRKDRERHKAEKESERESEKVK